MMRLSLINFCYISFPSSETNLLKLFTPSSSLCITVLMPTGLHHSALFAGGYVGERQTGSTFEELYPIETSPPSGKTSSAQSCVWTPGTCVPPVNTLQLTSMCVQTTTNSEVQKSESTFQIAGVVSDFVCHEIIPLKSYAVKTLK